MRLLVGRAVLAAALLASGPSFAQDFDNSDKLLVELTSNRPLAEALEAVYEFEAPSDAGDGGANIGESTLVRETVFYRPPDRLRLNLTWPDREEVFLAVNTSTMVMVGDQATDTLWPQPYVLYRLLADPDPGRLRELMVRFEVDMETVSSTKGAFIIGAGPDDPDRPQVWFDRETLRPVRLVLPARGGRPGYDIALSGYRRHDPGLEWPDRIEVKSTAAPPASMTLRSLRVNPIIEREDFDLEEIRRTVAPAPEGGADSDLYPELKKIRQQMEWFRKKLE